MTISPPSISELTELLDRERVVDRVTQLFLATDKRDWVAVEACFAPAVAFDMSSTGAGPAASRSPAEIADGGAPGSRT